MITTTDKYTVNVKDNPEEFNRMYKKFFDRRLHKTGNYRGVAKRILQDFLHTHSYIGSNPIDEHKVNYLVDCIVEAAVLETVSRLEEHGKISIGE